MNKIKYYLLWPIIAALSTAVIYLILVLFTHNILKNLDVENFIWDNFFTKEIILDTTNSKLLRMQNIIDNLPQNLLPTSYPKIKLLLKEDAYVNAYAAPGGRIVLTTGLLNNIKSENALLFVIGHEIAHLSRKDHLYEFSRTFISSSFGTISRSKLFAEILMIIDAEKPKEVEFIADREGLKMILYYYGHAGGIDEFFQTLQAQDNNKPINYTTSSHPDIRQRHHRLKIKIKNNLIETKEVVRI